MQTKSDAPLHAAAAMGSRRGVSASQSEQNIQQREVLAETITALALRSYHLPGYSWCSDWVQYMTNNHPLVGICCHHRLHPIGTCMRVLTLFGSFVFGLAITNIIFIWFVIHDWNINESLVTISVGGNNSTSSSSSSHTPSSSSSPFHGPDIQNGVTITEGMLALWTIGGALHAIFDNSVWFIAACPCCPVATALSNPHDTVAQLRKLGSYLILLVVLVTTTIATLVVVLRAALTTDYNNNNVNAIQSAGLLDDQVHITKVRARSFEFLLGYLIEVVLALFVYYPIVGTILFSGVLGCGRLPFLGGRPRDIRLEQQRNLEKKSRRISNNV